MTRSKNPAPGVSMNVIMTAVVVVAAVLVVGGLLLFNRSPDPAPGAAPADVLSPPGSHKLTEAPDGKVTVTEFLDYQCPACAGYYVNVIKTLEKDYAGRVTFVVRNFPLTSHPLGMPAARAAEAAAEQGKFGEMYHALYDNYGTWALAPDGQSLSDDTARAAGVFETHARDIGLDLARFTADLDNPAVQARVDKDIADGKAAGVSGTPSIFVNGGRFTPSGETFADADRALRELLDRELAA
ncbi:DsbA family protein [Actinokineospora sp. 24-640]